MNPQQPVSPTIAVRPAEAADLPAIADIYNEFVLNSAATFDTEPWTAEARVGWLREHSHPYAVLVAVHGVDIVGWGSLSPFRSKPAYRFTAEDSVYVRDGLQGDGIGARLLARLLEVAVENGFRTVIARIADENPASVRLHRRFGFRRVGLEREVGYKLGRWLEVLVMQKMLAD